MILNLERHYASKVTADMDAVVVQPKGWWCTEQAEVQEAIAALQYQGYSPKKPGIQEQGTLLLGCDTVTRTMLNRARHSVPKKPARN